jgi:hypothetical protein
MTIGDQIRKIKLESLRNEIRNLEKEVRAIRTNDFDSSDSDPDIQAYKIVIAEKKAELERM